MGTINREDVKGVYGDGGRLFCWDCAEEHKWLDEAKEGDILTQEDIEREADEKIFFCDNQGCGQQL